MTEPVMDSDDATAACMRFGKAVRVIASIEVTALIRRILTHVRGKALPGAATA